ncbi:hypothetical protein C8J57DRAFT_1351962 [Mycena rebaudengoi]|nr:hypothetical protein C8J57DRAFT_1351962 [Mycena rebaudengoi]
MPSRLRSCRAFMQIGRAIVSRDPRGRYGQGGLVPIQAAARRMIRYAILPRRVLPYSPCVSSYALQGRDLLLPLLLAHRDGSRVPHERHVDVCCALIFSPFGSFTSAVGSIAGRGCTDGGAAGTAAPRLRLALLVPHDYSIVGPAFSGLAGTPTSRLRPSLRWSLWPPQHPRRPLPSAVALAKVYG